MRYFLIILLCGFSTSFLQADPAEPSFLVMVKDKNELRIHSMKDAHVIKTYRAISGLNPGDKEKEGDKKTPEGIYFVLREIPKKQLVDLHGAAAYELSYPNIFDRLVKHSGSGIWIHGVGSESRLDKKFDTRGCIALSNKDVVDLKNYLMWTDTPVFVLATETAQSRWGIEPPGGPYAKRFEAWMAAWNSKDAAPYLTFYDARMRSRGMGFEEWSNYKSRLTKQYKQIVVKANNLKIFHHDKYALALYEQDYSSNRYHALSRKLQYWVGEPQDAKIISEEVVGVESAELIPLDSPTSGLSATTKENTSSLE